MNLRPEDKALIDAVDRQIMRADKGRVIEILNRLRKSYRIRNGQFAAGLVLNERYPRNTTKEHTDWHRTRYMASRQAEWAIDRLLDLVDAHWRD